MSSIFTKKDKYLLIKNLNFKGNLTHHDAPGSYDDVAYSVAKYADFSKKAQEYFDSIIGATNRLPVSDDIIGVTWSDKWGCSIYAFSGTTEALVEWYSGSDIEDDILDEIKSGYIDERYAVTNSDEEDYDLGAYNDGFRDAEASISKIIVSPKYKGLVMAALKEAYEHELLGSIGDRDACSLYHRLKYEDYCKERGIDYDDMTEEDFENAATLEIEESEREIE